ncbi:hypothetical protein B0H66DRAFT_635485 [Apodospora peruviana]|uniref:Uncharacterized protein n=1 Tax=Apodospora peruviana TaxID=516989 RepID=A0AAE0ISF6_9PEZI|nr:hypothetical protein B0H66DRAFT_635485 [Apodospora peruviana]
MSGYTDEALEEGHDLIYHAEEEAHMHDDEKMGPSKMKKGGLESSSSSGSKMQSESQSQGSNMKSKMGKKMDDFKDKMNMNK